MHMTYFDPYHTHEGLPALVVKNPPANAGEIRDTGLIPGLGRSLGEGYGNPLQYSSLENPMNRGACQAAVYRAAKIWIQMKWLSTCTYMGDSFSLLNTLVVYFHCWVVYHCTNIQHSFTYSTVAGIWIASVCAIMSNVTMNIFVHVFLCIYALFYSTHTWDWNCWIIKYA